MKEKRWPRADVRGHSPPEGGEGRVVVEPRSSPRALESPARAREISSQPPEVILETMNLDVCLNSRCLSVTERA